MILLTLGACVCTLAFFAGRVLARKLLRIQGARLIEREAEDRYFTTSRLRRAGFRLAGPLATYAACVVLAFLSIRTSGETVATLAVEVLPDGPAARAGMRTGDRILAVNGVAPARWEDVPAMVMAAPPETRMAVRVRRESSDLTLTVTPDENRKIRILSRQETRTVPATSALTTAATAPIHTFTRGTAELWNLVAGPSQTTMLEGPLSIVRQVEGSKASKSSLERMAALLFMLAATHTGYVWPLAIVLELALTPRRPRNKAAPAST